MEENSCGEANKKKESGNEGLAEMRFTETDLNVSEKKK